MGVAAGAAFTDGTALNIPNSIAARHTKRRKQGAEEISSTGGNCEQACNTLLANQRLLVKIVETKASAQCCNANICSHWKAINAFALLRPSRLFRVHLGCK
ncbi:hypothetical protein [Hymenobacter sp. B1770]|uniref:hypothetical protein n=1 Tax=Hymenobacter sp. B1770 TaxID=1718788 RepID=UPI003CF10569